MSENYILVAMATNFCNLRSFLENIQRLFGNFSLILITKNEPLLINTSLNSAHFEESTV